MENMDKELTVPKWVLIVWPKISQMPQNISAQMSAQAQKFKIFEKSSLWVSIVRGMPQNISAQMSAQAQKFKIFEKSSLWVSIVRGMNNGKTPLKDPLERLLGKTLRLQGLSAVKIL